MFFGGGNTANITKHLRRLHSDLIKEKKVNMKLNFFYEIYDQIYFNYLIRKHIGAYSPKQEVNYKIRILRTSMFRTMLIS